jgi:methanogenic corrinoid protein MtbC1
MGSEELDLRSLSDEELVLQMHNDLYDGLKEEIEDSVHILLERGWSPYRTLTEALVEGMRIVAWTFGMGSSSSPKSCRRPTP